MATSSPTDLIDAIEDVLQVTLDLARALDDADGERPTDCPGWTVKDQLSHMVGLEQVQNGAPAPTIELPPFDHVVNDFDIYMEKIVHIRRDLPLAAIADELAGLLPRRVARLRDLAAEGDPDVLGPFGMRPLSATLPIRVFDLWAHEQDIRRALGLPARTSGSAAEVALGRALMAWTATLPKKVTGVNGQLMIEVTGPTRSVTTLTFGSGGPSAQLKGDLGMLTWLGCGRGTADGTVLDGDPAVVAAVASHLGFTP